MAIRKPSTTPLESPAYTELVTAISARKWKTADYWAKQLHRQFPGESATTYWNMAHEDANFTDEPEYDVTGASFDPFSFSGLI